MKIPIENPTIKNGMCLNITQKFGENVELYQQRFGIPGHNGIDFTYMNPLSLPAGEASYGKPILAAHDGKITRLIWNGEHDTRGNGVYLTSDKFETVYWHLSKILCDVGQTVASGAKLGEMGNSGYVMPPPTAGFPLAGTHLHFGVRPLPIINNPFDGYVDPYPYLDQLNMLKILGDKKTNKQYVLGNDSKLHWIFNETLLDSLHDSGVISKFNIEWVDGIAGFEMGEVWACIK